MLKLKFLKQQKIKLVVSLFVISSLLYLFFVFTSLVKNQFTHIINKVSEEVSSNISDTVLISDSGINETNQGSADCEYAKLNRSYRTTLSWEETEKELSTLMGKLNFIEGRTMDKTTLSFSNRNEQSGYTFTILVTLKNFQEKSLSYEIRYFIGENRCLGG